MSDGHSTRTPRKRRPQGTPPVIEYDEAPCPNPNLNGPCHIWRGAKIGNGYGNTIHKGKSVLVHRYIWELKCGPIPDGLRIDHQCRTRACCNVDHLRVVTHKVNTTENSSSVGAINKAKTHCPAGHEFTPENTRINVCGSRVCRACRKRQGVEANERRKKRLLDVANRRE